MMNRNELKRVECDGHVWEYGHFSEVDNGFSAFGFRQDGAVIRVTSKYEAELFGKAISLLVASKDMYEALKTFIQRTERAKGIEFSPSMVGAYINMKQVLAKVEGK